MMIGLVAYGMYREGVGSYVRCAIFTWIHTGSIRHTVILIVVTV